MEMVLTSVLVTGNDGSLLRTVSFGQ